MPRTTKNFSIPCSIRQRALTFEGELVFAAHGVDEVENLGDDLFRGAVVNAANGVEVGVGDGEGLDQHAQFVAVLLV